MKKSITLIGNGNMALSIAKGLQKHYTIEIVGRNMDKLDKFEKKLEKPIKKHLLDGFDISDKNIILCIKPYNVEEVGAKLKGKAKLIASILAGTKIETLMRYIKAQFYIRAMPNLGASVGASMTTMTGDNEYKDEAQKLFDAIGETLWLNSEEEIDIATALAGSGPAYLAMVAQALSDAAVKEGLKRDDANVLMQGLFKGFGELIQNEEAPHIKNSVMSPAGTTAYGCYALEKAGIKAAFMDAVSSAYSRAKELS
ncbi:MAG: pyrroline-5-carboxylate reductase [Campylobacterales bacterium]|nr:pyrroline-5-carboxylate reductase [Campylobacterales bacterium]